MSVARVYKAPTPYNAEQLDELDYVQSFDVLYLAHLDHSRGKFVRAGHFDWTFSSLTAGPTIDEPTGLGVTVTNPNQDADATPPGNAYFPQPRNYAVTAVNDETGQESRASATASGTNDLSLKRNKNTLAWNAVTGADRYRVYAADNEQDFGFIGEAEGVAFTDDNIEPDLTDGPPEGTDPFASATDADGRPLNNPSTAAFFENRLWWGRTRLHPNAIFGSRSADFENHDISRPLKEDDGVSFAISAQKVNSVHSLVPLEELLALTGDAVFRILGSNADYLTAAPPPRAVRQLGTGISRLKPLVVDETTFMTPNIGSGVLAVGFTFEVDGYRSNDVSIFSPGFFKGYTIDDWTYSQEPLSVIFAARSDGKMPSFTWQRDQSVWGWTLCETGVRGTADERTFGDDIVERMTSVREGGEDRVYLVVRRRIAGVERRFLERMGSAKWSEQEEALHLDCAVTFRPTEPQQEFLVPHLAGEIVDAFADGNVVKDIQVDLNGVADIGFEAETIVHIGLPYEAVIETLPLMAETGEGWPRNKRQMVGDIVLQVADTRLGSVEVGRRRSKMYRLRARHTEAPGTPTELYTGPATASTEPVTLDSLGRSEATLFIRSAEPTPMTVTAVYLDPRVDET